MNDLRDMTCSGSMPNQIRCSEHDDINNCSLYLFLVVFFIIYFQLKCLFFVFFFCFLLFWKIKWFVSLCEGLFFYSLLFVRKDYGGYQAWCCIKKKSSNFLLCFFWAWKFL